MIYKIIQLNNLAVYWNTDTKSLLRQDRGTLLVRQKYMLTP